MAWESRIIGLEKQPANQLLAHPYNARRHPARQRNALRASLDTLGVVAPVIVNRQTGYVLDGHARIEEYLSRDEHAEIDVLYVDLSEQEEAQFLATFDYITYLAEFDKDILAGLLEEIDISAPGMDALVEDMKSLFSSPSSEDWAGALNLPDGEKPPFMQMTFTLHNEQIEVVEQALRLAKQFSVDERNANSNGNALHYLALVFLEGQES